MTHWTSVIVAFMPCCSAGSATFTAVPSMNVMLDATMVAIRVPRCAPVTRRTCARQGATQHVASCAGSYYTRPGKKPGRARAERRVDDDGARAVAGDPADACMTARAELQR